MEATSNQKRLKRLIIKGWLVVASLIFAALGTYYLYDSIVPSPIFTNSKGTMDFGGGATISAPTSGETPADNSISSVPLESTALAQIDPKKAKRGLFFQLIALCIQTIISFM